MTSEKLKPFRAWIAWHPERSGSIHEILWSDKQGAITDMEMKAGVNPRRKLPDGRRPWTEEELYSVGWRIVEVEVREVEKGEA